MGDGLLGPRLRLRRLWLTSLFSTTKMRFTSVNIASNLEVWQADCGLSQLSLLAKLAAVAYLKERTRVTRSELSCTPRFTDERIEHVAAVLME